MSGAHHQNVLKYFSLIFMTYNPFYLLLKIWNLLGDKQGLSMGYFDSMNYSLYFGVCLDVLSFITCMFVCALCDFTTISSTFAGIEVYTQFRCNRR